LRRIENSCFKECSLRSICIPPNVDFIDGSAFARSNYQSITVDSNNRRFSIDQDFLIDNIEMRLIQYFESSNHVHIWDDIEILGKSCFDCCDYLESIAFESRSPLKRIEKGCFLGCSLKSIYIPRNVKFLDASCFESSVLESITFES
jgi:hypothetical protein